MVLIALLEDSDSEEAKGLQELGGKRKLETNGDVEVKKKKKKKTSKSDNTHSFLFPYLDLYPSNLLFGHIL